jgi:HSP20 family protein
MFSSFESEPSVINLSDEISGGSNFRRAVSDFSETDNEYVLEVELPGMKKEEISLDITSRGIEIKASRKSEKKKEEDGKHFYGKSFAGFYQAIDLPENADSGKIKASYKNGVLSLKIPKKKVEIEKVKRIEIE